MGIGLIKGKSALFLKEEVTEGTYVAPASAADAVEVLEDGLEFGTTREVIERNTLSATVESEAPRLGIKTVTGTIPTELKASSTEGAAPPADLLWESLLGGKRQNTTTVTSKNAAHTSTVIQIEDADISKFAVGDVVLVKEAGQYEVRPISVVTSTLGAASITFPFALKNGAPANSVLISKFTTYYPDDNWPTISASLYNGGEILDKEMGLRCLTGSIENWTTGQVPTLSFGVEGIESDRTVTATPFVPNFSADALPPVLLDACAYLGGIEIDYNEFALSIENTKADIPTACQPSGKAGTRITQLSVSGSINPYMEDDDVVRWDAFEANSDTSLFVFARNPGAVVGEGKEWICVWLPKIKITELGTGDQDGVLTDAISFQAFKSAGNDTVFVGFI